MEPRCCQISPSGSFLPACLHPSPCSPDTHTHTLTHTHRTRCKVSPKVVQQLLMALSLGPHNGQRDGVRGSRQEVGTRGHLDFVGGHGCSSGGRKGTQSQTPGRGPLRGAQARKGKSDTGRSGKASLPRQQGEAGTQSLEKLLPLMAGGPRMGAGQEPGWLGWGRALAGEQVSGLRALWELAGRKSREGSGPASERGRVEDASIEGGFRVGEPVQPEPEPQGSWEKGQGEALDLYQPNRLLPFARPMGCSPGHPCQAGPRAADYLHWFWGPQWVGTGEGTHCPAGLLPCHSSLGNGADSGHSRKLAHPSAPGPRTQAGKSGGCQSLNLGTQGHRVSRERWLGMGGRVSVASCRARIS